MSSLVLPTLPGIGDSSITATPKGLKRLGIPSLRVRKFEGLLVAAGIFVAGLLVAVPTEYTGQNTYTERVLAAEHVQTLISLQPPPETDTPSPTYLTLPRYELPLKSGPSHQQTVSTPGV